MLVGWRNCVYFLLLAASVAALPAPAIAAVLKIATIAPEGSQWMREMRSSAAAIKERTDGRVVVKYYGGGVMGNDRKVLRKIRIGQLQGGAFAASGLIERYPDIGLYGLPLIFRSQAEVDYIRERFDPVLMDGLEQAGFVSFGFAGGGFALMMSSEPATRLDDLRGLKIWVPEGDRISSLAMVAMNLSPVVLPISDVLTGLQTGLVDIVATPPVAALLLQWYTKVHYVTEVPIAYSLGLMAVDKRAFDQLSETDQQIFREVMTATYKTFEQNNRTDNEAAKSALQSNGLKFIPAEPGTEVAWRRQVMPTNIAFWGEGRSTPELLPQLLEALDRFRAQTEIPSTAEAAADR